jgi:hypothetical protein
MAQEKPSIKLHRYRRYISRAYSEADLENILIKLEQQKNRNPASQSKRCYSCRSILKDSSLN